ncbi:Multidrug resistance-associated protein 1 [Thoreauomyces humboldtii]|nr:Multidrug resistance-associated protein 1 [Thoreauomyces humboldtii]
MNPVSASSPVLGHDALDAKPSHSQDNDQASVSTRGIWSFVSLAWIDPLLKTGFRKTLQENDLPALLTSQKSVASADVLEPFWDKLRQHRSDGSAKPSLMEPFVREYHLLFIASCILQGITVAVSILLPTQIDNVVAALDSPDRIIKKAFVYAAIYACLQLVWSVCLYTYHSLDVVITMGVRSIAIGGVYRKTLLLSPRARAEFTPGHINSLIDVDVPACQAVFVCGIDLVGGSVQVAVALYFLAKVLGVTTWVTAGIYVGIAALIGAVMPLYGAAQGRYMQALDSRTRTLREFLRGIQSIKYKGMEDRHLDIINVEREKQLKALRRIMFSFSLIMILILFQSGSLPVLTIIAYSKLGGAVAPGSVFTILGLLGALISPSADLPENLQGVMAFLVSYGRLTKFMYADELDPNEVTTRQPASVDAEAVVLLQDASFAYETPGAEAATEQKERGQEMEMVQTQAFSLKNLSLSVKKGQLVCVVGAVGSGKSTLLTSLLGEVRKTGGHAILYGSVAYCAQEPYVTTGTIAQNIIGLFDTKSSKTTLDSNVSSTRLQDALEAACLEKDIDAFPLGVGTWIGEKGMTLSGGQRARVALARAWASDPDVLLLDDPLSALDARVGKKVFEETICGRMKERTVVMVTHQLQLLAKSDLVVVMDHGAIVETGDFATLRSDATSRLSDLMKSYRLEDEKDITAKPKTIQSAALEKVHSEDDLAGEAVEEDRREGAVSSHILWTYFTVSGIWVPIVLFLAMIVYVGVQSLTNILLVIWSGDQWNWTTTQYFNIYAIFGTLGAVLAIPQMFSIFYCAYRAAVSLHKTALDGLGNAPMSFYQDQPVGRILNRMSTDITSLDLQMGDILLTTSGSLCTVLNSLVIMCYSSYYMVPAIIVLGVPASLLFRYYRRSYREVKRLSSTMRSPLNSHLSETFNGIPTIAAYGAQDKFMTQLELCMDRTNMSTLLLNSINFWLGLRLDVLASCVVFLLLVLAGLRVVSPSAIGLGLVSTMDFGLALNSLLRNMGTLEASFNSVERLDHYAKSLPVESARTLPNDPASDDPWPSQGEIEIKDLEIRYRPTDDPVIKHLSLSIRPGEKIGVVGRSGAGKSTLMAALYRMMEFTHGTITIDGRDISAMGLHCLRRRMSIITQDPILFEGTIRTNLDPLSLHTDDEIWSVLRTTGLHSHVSDDPSKLDLAVTSGGTNLSSGQRSLLSLATALLARPKILILDEATAAVDADADARVRGCMAREFADTTVVSVAHRLESVAAFDRVLVMRDGERVEFDPPWVLLQREESEFAALVRASGPAGSESVRETARKAWEGKGGRDLVRGPRAE